jgi:hypothetical protein
MSRHGAALGAGIAAFLAAFALATNAGAQSDAGGLKLTLNYDGRILFLKVLDIQFRAALNPGAHSSSARISSYGILAAFKKFNINATETGAVAHGQPQPGLFKHENHDGKNNRKVAVTWTAEDVDTKATPELKFLGDPPASRAQRLGSVGYLTAILRLALADNAGPCRSVETIFNGKELSELGFSQPRPITLTPAQRKLGLTHGLSCTTEFKEVAGYKKKKGKDRNQGLDRPIEADFARLGEDGPWAPFHVQAQTPLGPAVIDLASVEVSGKVPTDLVQTAGP